MKRRNKFVVATKGICLVCLKKVTGHEEEAITNEEKKDDVSNSNTGIGNIKTKTPTNQSLMEITRFLKVDFANVFHEVPIPSDMAKALEYTEMMVPVCLECSYVLEKFGRLYNEFERLRLNLFECVNTIRDLMGTGESDLERVKEYSKLTTATNPVEMVNAKIVNNLRNEVIEKCTSRLRSSHPTVKLERVIGETLMVPTTMVSKDILSNPNHHQNSPHCVKEESIIASPTYPNFDDVDMDYDKNMETQVMEISVGVDVIKTEQELDDELTMDLSLRNDIFEDSEEEEEEPLEYDPLDITPVNKRKRNSDGIRLEYEPEVDNGLNHSANNSSKPEGNNILSKQNDKKNCHVCGKSVNRSGLVRHYRLHTGEKPYKCVVCKQTFADRGNARQHTVRCHQTTYFSNILSAGNRFVSPQESSQALKTVLQASSKSSEMQNSFPEGTSRMYGCRICGRDYIKSDNVISHVIFTHFKIVRETLYKMLYDTDIPFELANAPFNKELVTKVKPRVKTRRPRTGILRNLIDQSKSVSDVVQVKPSSSVQLSDKTQPSTESLDDIRIAQIFKQMFPPSLPPSTSRRKQSFTKTVPNSSKLGPERILTCSHCATHFLSNYEYRVHQLTQHRYEVFAKYFPPGTTSSHADSVILRILDEYNDQSWEDKDLQYRCIFCFKEHVKLSSLQAHILVVHFNEVASKIQSYFSNEEEEDEDDQPEGEYQLRISEGGISSSEIGLDETDADTTVKVEVDADGSLMIVSVQD